MAERYTRIYSSPVNLYTSGAPIVIAAGALLKDNQTGKVLAQIKFQSISKKQIKAVKISVSAFDVSGKELEGIAEYQYLDLIAARAAEFGQKQAVTLPDEVTRSFVAKCTDVIFTDGTVWSAAPDAIWTTLPAQKSVTAQLGNLAAQYQRDTSYKSQYIPMEHEDLWLCSCGAINHSEETKCHKCCYGKELLFAALDVDALRQGDTEYNAAETEKKSKHEAEKAEHRYRITKFSIVVAMIVAVIASICLLMVKVVIPNSKYNNAIALMEAGQYEDAISIFEALEGYKDSAIKIDTCEVAILDEKYEEALSLMNSGRYEEAVAIFEMLDGHKDSEHKLVQCAQEFATKEDYTNALATYLVAGNYIDIKDQVLPIWDHIAIRETISAESQWTVGLESDGTVVAVGKNDFGRCDVENLTDIIAISVAGRHTVGLRSDGTVVAVGDNDLEQCNVKNWEDIVAISADGGHTVGLRSDGTVVAVGTTACGQCDVGDWRDIVAIGAGNDYTVGLKSDGTVVAVGCNYDGRCDVEDWTDIIAINVGYDITVGLKSDGTVVAVGENDYGQCDVDDWADIVLPK